MTNRFIYIDAEATNGATCCNFDASRRHCSREWSKRPSSNSDTTRGPRPREPPPVATASHLSSLIYDRGFDNAMTDALPP
jgi:hypothetical protein